MMHPDQHPDSLSDEEKRRIEDRFEAHRRAPETSIPWEEVRARLFAVDRAE